MNTDVTQIQAQVEQESGFVNRLIEQLSHVIVGQKYLVERLIIGLLADGHILIEGVPGLAKTLSVKTLADSISVKFSRLQFTPDLLPADLIGTMIFKPQTAEYVVRKGPIFGNIILADEINRAPGKVQSALLEAMQERQVTISGTSYKLDEPFLVMATQNPIEQEGTYPLPEAQVDRFMMKLKIGYPTPSEEMEIMNRNTGSESLSVEAVVSSDDILRARKVLREIYVDDLAKEYIVNLVFASREPEKFGLNEIKDLIDYGASPRATIYLNLAAKAHAFLKGRGYVTPDDIKAIAPDVLRHRILTSFEAVSEEKDSDYIISQIVAAVVNP